MRCLQMQDLRDILGLLIATTENAEPLSPTCAMLVSGCRLQSVVHRTTGSQAKTGMYNVDRLGLCGMQKRRWPLEPTLSDISHFAVSQTRARS